MREKLQRFMFGRYGQDGLSRFLLILSVVLYLPGLFLQFLPLSLAALALVLWASFRMLSRNGPRRQSENAVYYQFRRKFTLRYARLKNRLHDMKTHRIFKCPFCRQQLRVPKGKGKLSITCPHCKGKFIKRT